MGEDGAAVMAWHDPLMNWTNMARGSTAGSMYVRMYVAAYIAVIRTGMGGVFRTYHV